MKYKPLIFILLSVFFIAFARLISCTPQACQEETQSLVKATFYKYGTDSIKAPDSLTVYGLGRDTSLIYNKSLNLKTIQIPLDASAGTCGFVFRINGITDTLTFSYTSYPHLVSKECGFTFYHILDSYTVTGQTIDTVKIINKSITTIHEENIRIFY
jgi:hypothetical protein